MVSNRIKRILIVFRGKCSKKLKLFMYYHIIIILLKNLCNINEIIMKIRFFQEHLIFIKLFWPFYNSLLLENAVSGQCSANFFLKLAEQYFWKKYIWWKIHLSYWNCSHMGAFNCYLIVSKEFWLYSEENVRKNWSYSYNIIFLKNLYKINKIIMKIRFFQGHLMCIKLFWPFYNSLLLENAVSGQCSANFFLKLAEQYLKKIYLMKNAPKLLKLLAYGSI